MFAPRWQEFVLVVHRHLLPTIQSDCANPLNTTEYVRFRCVCVCVFVDGVVGVSKKEKSFVVLRIV